MLETFSEWPVAWSPLVARITAAYLTVGVLAFFAWQLSGNDAWVIQFFRVPAAVLMVFLALVEFWLSSAVLRHFSSDDLLRPGWTLIACSAGCQFVGMICSQVMGVNSSLNPLNISSSAGESLVPLMRSIGLLIGGTFRFALLAGGLHFALKAYRQSDLLGRLTRADWVVFGAFGAFILRNVADVVVAVRHGHKPDVWEVFGWPVDPLLLLLLLQALLLFRSTQQMGAGRIGLCWKAFSVGVFLTALGDVGLWAANYNYLPWPWNALIWYVWLPAAAAFARAPAFQLEVLRNARNPAGSLLAEMLRSSEP